MSTNHKVIIITVGLCIVFLFSSYFSINKAPEQNAIKVFAAASTISLTNSISNEFSKISGNTIITTFSSSGTLARQIANGADADIYISANRKWIDYLIEKQVIDSASVTAFASNSLVIVSRMPEDTTPPGFVSTFNINTYFKDQIAIAEPETAPLGEYTKEVLENLKWYKTLKPSIIMGQNAMSTLRYIEIGEARWGIVYHSDALKSKNVHIVAEIPESLHSPILYYHATVNKTNPMTETFKQLLSDALFKKLLSSYGFKPISTNISKRTEHYE